MSDASLVIICALLVATGLVLLGLGLRGRRVNDHPICRRCRYDLYGLDAPATCPECGAALSGRQSVRHGQRRRRLAMIVAGAVLAVVALTIGGHNVWRTVQFEGVYPYMPLPWLCWRVDGDDDRAFDEITWRIDDDELTDGQVESLIARGLGRYRHLHPQRDYWAEILSVLRYEGFVLDDEWIEYGHLVTDLTLDVRSRVRAG